MLTAVAGISACYSKFAFVLFCYITNHFVLGNIEILGKQNSLFPSGPVITCLMFATDGTEREPVAVYNLFARKRPKEIKLDDATWP